MTATKEFSKETLKSALQELVQEDPAFFLELLKMAVGESNALDVAQKAERKKRIEALVKEDFEKYDEVFKALA